MLVQQLGFFYADGTLERLSRRALAGLTAAGLASLVVLTGTGMYRRAWSACPAEVEHEPAHGLHRGAHRLAARPGHARRARVSAWLARRGPWTANREEAALDGDDPVPVASPAVAALYGLVLAIDGPLPNPGTGAWWATRPLWLALLTAVLVPLALALSRFERSAARQAPPRGPSRPSPAASPPCWASSWSPSACSASWRAASRPARPGGPARSYRVDPLQNVLHLVVGARTPRGGPHGATDHQQPWLLAAAGQRPSLALPSAGPVGAILHLAVAALALTVAASRHAATGPAGMRIGGGRSSSLASASLA